MAEAPQPRRFFVSPDVLRARNVTITGDLARRLARVLRLRRGDTVVLTAGGPREYVVRFDGVSANAITGVVIDERAAPAEAAAEVVLYQSLIRPNRFDIALEKGTEIGVARFVPVIAARSQVTEETSSGRAERWRRLIVEAAEQCGRGRLPPVDEPMSFEDALRTAPGLKIVPWEDERRARLAAYLHSLPERPHSVSVFIGPEGGYTEEEVALARESGAALVTLGRRVMRSETAAVVACGIILHELDG
jgi:16S rRNA (uracil1498-N3)-methyltransferase